MRRFFFDIRTVDFLAEDLFGDILPDTESALAEAGEAARQLASDVLRNGKKPVPVAVHIRDETGSNVGVVDVVDAVLKALGRAVDNEHARATVASEPACLAVSE